MRKLALLVVLLGCSALAGGLALDVGRRFEFTDCASGGSAAQTLTTGQYLFRVTDADVFICYEATCASGGERFAVGSIIGIAIGLGGQQVSCRSATSTGDAIFTGYY